MFNVLPSEFLQQYFVDGLYASSAFLDTTSYVFAYIIYIIKEVAEGIEHGVRLCSVFCSFRIGQNADAQMLYVYVDICARYYGVAIIVDCSWLFAVYANALCSEGFNL